MSASRDDAQTRMSDASRSDSTMESDPRRPVKRRAPQLVRVFGGSGRLRAFDLEEELTLLGRAVPPGGIPLSDPRCSRVHASVRLDGGDVIVQDLSQKNGTFVDGQRVRETTLPDGGVLRTGDTLFVLRSSDLDQGPGEGRDEGRDDDPRTQSLLGISRAMCALRRQVTLVAETDAWVLLLGATGTGKEVTARALHAASGRAGELVAVNCGAIPEQLAESELFGHRKGAFTGADRDHDGFFLRANGGTLFLDEVGEMPLSVQAKLLRALDDRRVARVGDKTSTPLDLRVVAATNRDLAQEVKRGAFRADVFARLADITLELPPLTQRREDILLLLRDALDDEIPLEADLAERLLCHPWPFNVRELKKAAVELKVRGQGQPAYTVAMIERRLSQAWLTMGEEPPAEADDGGAPPASSEPRPPPSRDEVIELLRAHGGNLVEVAKAAGRSRKQVYRWLAKHGLDANDYRPEGPQAS